MESDEGSQTPLQGPSGPVMGGQNVEGRREKSGKKSVEWTLGVKTSKPLLTVQLLPSGSNQIEPRVAYQHHHCDDEQEGDSDNNTGPGTVYAEVDASQKDIQHRKDKGTAAAQTQMPSTKPKARTLVAGGRLIDGSEVACLRDQSCPPLLTVKGTVGLVASDPRRTSSLQASITGEASVSAVLRDAPITQTRSSDVNREETKRQYYRDLSRQVEEKNQERERERRRNYTEEKKHNETMQRWMPGSSAPYNHLGTVRRTTSLCTAGILPQEQVRELPFHYL